MLFIFSSKVFFFFFQLFIFRQKGCIYFYFMSPFTFCHSKLSSLVSQVQTYMQLKSMYLNWFSSGIVYLVSLHKAFMLLLWGISWTPCFSNNLCKSFLDFRFLQVFVSFIYQQDIKFNLSSFFFFILCIILFHYQFTFILFIFILLLSYIP